MDVCPYCHSKQARPRKRSAADHRRLFAIIAQAFRNWPENNDFHPESPEHLRAWLICAAIGDSGVHEWADVTLFETEGGTPGEAFVRAIEAGIRASNGRGFVRSRGNKVAIFAPKSMSWSRMPQSEFSRLRSAIEDVIVAETGLSIAELKQEREDA